MAEQNVGKVTQIISAVLDIKFSQGKLPKINEAIRIKTQDGTTLTAEVAQHWVTILSAASPWEAQMDLCEAWKQ